MFSAKQTPPPPSAPEPNGIEIRVKLSEATLAKLISLIIAILLGSGALAYHTQSAPLPTESPTDAVEVFP